MELTAKNIKEKALELGADIVGIGDIALFAGTDPQRDPKSILPEAKTILGFGFRIPRAFYRTMADRKQFFNYTQLGVKVVDEELSEVFLLKMAGIIENEGYDACVQRNVSNLRIKGDKTTNPEVIDTYELSGAEAVAPGKPAPEIILDFAQCAKICGLGEAGLDGHILTPEFGPFVRFVFLVTDAEMECDKPFSGKLCDHCGKCIPACPGHAVSDAGLDSWQCAVYYRGAHKSNPFMTNDVLKGNPEREEILEGRKHFDAASAREIYKELKFLPSSATGYIPCLCGKSCDMVCYTHLKEKGALK